MKMATRSILKNSKGQIGVFVIVVIVIIFAVFLSGGLSFKEAGKQSQQSQETIASSGFCCDSGDGDQCKPQTGEGKQFAFQGTEYGLLKSNVIFEEQNFHLKDSGEKFNGDPIILNTSDGYSRVNQGPYPGFECGLGTQDQIFKSKRTPIMSNQDIGALCVPIPNDQIVYVCKKSCHPGISDPTRELYYYGDRTSVYDVYFKLSDYPNPGVPDVIKNCDKTPLFSNAPTGKPRQSLIFPTGELERENLHLGTFKVINQPAEAELIPWFSPFCKPAIYLYPQEKSNVNVLIAPQGKLILTIPKYPPGGWQVTAYPSGKIDHQNSTYEYLYYEAEIPDDKIPQPKEGFVVEYKNLSSFFNDALPKLGLNEKETAEFSSYWLKALPKSPYYYIGIVAQSTLNNIAPLTITPKPDNIIRVTLYFKALEQRGEVRSPQIVTPKRDGFTVVEWGGIFKTDKNHSFSCLM